MLPFCTEMCLINYGCFDLFSNLNTVQNLPNFFFQININTLNIIPSIWDIEKSLTIRLKESLQMVVSCCEVLYLILHQRIQRRCDQNDGVTDHQTGQLPGVKTKGKSWNIKDLPKAKTAYTSLLFSTIILIAFPSCSRREIDSKIRRHRTFASISINLSPLVAAMLFSLNLMTFQDLIHEYRKS